MPSTEQVHIALAAAALARVLDRVLAEAQLSTPQYRLLAHLSTGSAAASRLADAVASSRPNITSLVDNLVAKGYVARSGDPSDRRRVSLALTPEGADALKAADAAVDAALRELTAAAPPSDAEQAIEGLRAWGRVFDAVRARRSEQRDG